MNAFIRMGHALARLGATLTRANISMLEYRIAHMNHELMTATDLDLGALLERKCAAQARATELKKELRRYD